VKKNIVFTFVLMGLALSALPAADFGASVSAYPSPYYNGVWSLGLQGMGAGFQANFPLQGLLTPSKDKAPLYATVGAEFGLDSIGNQVIAPIGLGYRFYDDGRWRLGVEATGQLGLALFRPMPLVMLGAEARVAAAWFFSAKAGLEVSVGLRALYCPWYNDNVAPFADYEIPVGLAIVWK
jgi:hypothetical protein